jgi:hypothetical protein
MQNTDVRLEISRLRPTGADYGGQADLNTEYGIQILDFRLAKSDFRFKCKKYNNFVDFGIKSQIANLQSATFLLRSKICNLRSAICDLQSEICDLRSAICNLQFEICDHFGIKSAICNLQSAICDHFGIKSATFLLRSKICNLRSFRISDRRFQISDLNARNTIILWILGLNRKSQIYNLQSEIIWIYS